MSHFISANNTFSNTTEETKNILEGILSRISLFESPPLLTQHPLQQFFKQKVSVRVKQQQKQAYLVHDQSLTTSFKKLKGNLTNYGRSISCKLSTIFQKQNTEKITQEAAKKQKQNSYKHNKKQRVVFVDRKYNCQLSIKAAALCQLQKISKIKQQKRAYSCHDSAPPLVMQLFRKQQPKVSTIQNPLLVKIKESRLRKRKPKQLK